MILELILWLDRDCPYFDLHQYGRRFLFNKYTFSIYLPKIEWRLFTIWLPNI